MAVPGGIMSAEDNKAIVTASFEAIFNQHQVDRAAEFYAPDYLDHAAAPGTAAGLEGAKQKWSAYIAALPDMRATIVDLVAEGEKVAVAWTVEGTHRGVLLGIAATGRYVRLSGMALYRLAGGKITEASEEFDKLNLMQQLGVLPASTAPAPATG